MTLFNSPGLSRSRKAVSGDLLRPLHHRRTQPPLVEDRDVECLHQRAGVLAESLLAGHAFVAVVPVFHLPLLRVVREADVVVRGEQ